MPPPGSIMKKTTRILLAVILLLSLVTPLLADTIKLKDGSVIRGQVIGFKDQQFTILIGGNAKGRRGQTTVYVEDVESIDFESTSGGAISQTDDSSTNISQPNRPAPQNNQPDSSSSTARIGDAPSPVSANPTFFTIKVSVRADNANNGWTTRGLGVRKGRG